MASPEKIAPMLPETLPEDFSDWDSEASSLCLCLLTLASGRHGKPLIPSASLQNRMGNPLTAWQSWNPLLDKAA